ncbi:MAG: hypothetical protein OHK0012_24220 [Synechococcales cyanobacterium]
MKDPYLHQVLLERYHLTRLLGEGAMGRVYLATDRMLGDVSVAIKILTQPLTEPRMQQRFRQEAMACAALGQKSLHVVRVSDFGITDWGSPFYVMEYLRGRTLRELIAPGLAPERWLSLTRQMVLALKAAHEGIVLQGHTVQVIHRDLKPANVMVIPDDSLGELVKLVDFGVAKLLTDQGHVSLTHSFVGTLAYASPEQLEGLPLDPRSDLYSLGIILYQMACGKVPFIASTDTFAGWYQVHHKQRPAALPEAITRTFPRAWQEVIHACLEKNPDHRPSSAAAILTLLEGTAPVGAMPRGIPSLAHAAVAQRQAAGQAEAPTQALGSPKGSTKISPQISPSLSPSISRATRYIPAPVDSPQRSVPGWLALVGGSLLGLASVVAVTTIVAGDPYRTALSQGNQALQNGDYATAQTQFQLALEHRPNDRQALTGLAMSKRQTPASLDETPTASTSPTPAPTTAPSADPSADPSATPIAAVNPLDTLGRDPAQSPELQSPTFLQGFQVSLGRPSVHEELGSPAERGSENGQSYETFRPIPDLPIQVTVAYDQQDTVLGNRVVGIPPTVVSALLEGMLQVQRLPTDVQQKLQAVQSGQTQSQSFQSGNLEGEITRDPQGQLTVATWDRQRKPKPKIVRPSRN